MNNYLSIERLLKENETLKRELRARDTFIGVATHEIKTPLTVISLYASQLERQEESAVGRIIARECAKLTRMINTLFDYTKLVAGNYPFERRRVCLVELIRRKIRSFDLVYPDRQIIFSPALRQAILFTDPLCVEQIITNLLTNAIRYSKKEITITVKKKANDTYRVNVKDQGEGIPSRVQRVIWEAFSKPSALGLGLGLFIVKQFTDGLGGSITFVSHEGVGTTFTLTISSLKPAKNQKEVNDT